HLLQHGCCQAIALPHHDQVGEDHMYVVARCNLDVGIQTKIIRLPGLADHEDVSDWVDRGGTQEDLLQLVANTLSITPAELPAPKPVSTKKPTSSKSYQHDPRLNGIFFEALKIKPRCLFHPDVNPSLSIDLDRGLFFCHGCAIGGSVAAFYVKVAALKGRT